ncbi:hypothetical protein HNO89_003190 [Sporosarcina luteola]|nr:hypothetical protein [Sporosarcina luteola]
MKNLMGSLLTMALTVVIFSIAFSWVSYVPSSQREIGSSYSSFSGTFILVLVFAGPIYFIVGTPLSIFIDKLIRKSNRKSNWGKYFYGFILYSLSGAIVGVLFTMLSGYFNWNELIPYSLLGFIASNFYYHLSLLMLKTNNALFFS